MKTLKTISLITLRFAVVLIVMTVLLGSTCESEKEADDRYSVLFDTDANNELDDQHAMAYLFFNSDIFDVVGVTVNATKNGGDINGHYNEARRVMQLCNVYGEIPLFKGANGSFKDIRLDIQQDDFDGEEAVNFIIEQAHKKEKLVLLPVGKLTNIALALEKDPSIASKVRIVWLGSNYPEPGEYNQNNDRASLNYILEQDVPFEMVTVRYGKKTGTSAVSVTRGEIANKMIALGPKAGTPVTGRHGGSFETFGDYSINLFQHIHTSDKAGTRPLFDMAAVAIVKNPQWANKKEIPAPLLLDKKWVERPENTRKIILWENFDKKNIINDFYDRMKNYVLPE